MAEKEVKSVVDPQHPLIVCRASAGTGKTFTLSAYYIALLFSGESYRNILAVTFTKAATAEMKERILTYLMGIAKGGEKVFLQKVREFMLRNNDKSDEELSALAETNMHAILQDYDNFNVTTIDSFLQQLISGMAHALNRTADFTISIDVKQVISVAVDTLLTEELSDSKSTVVEYASENIGENKGWDIRENLISIAMQLYEESVQANKSKIVYDEKRIAEYRKALYAEREVALSNLRQMFQEVEGVDVKGIKNTIQNIKNSLLDPESVKEKKDVFRGAPNSEMNKVMATPQLRALQEACDATREIYWRTTCSLRYLNDLRLMDALAKCIERSLLRTNTALLADTALTLDEALKPGDADFILEKAGIRYRHIMIDEFQDTSVLQWNVFLHLIKEILAVQGQTVLVVGDTKQSIYRFRNGDWRIMEGLGKKDLKEEYNPNSTPLKRNQRSRENIVRFNLSVMHRVAQELGNNQYDENPDAENPQSDISDYYCVNKHGGGYVRCRFYPYYHPSKKNVPDALKNRPQKEALWANVCATIEDLLGKNERPQDILVLSNKNAGIQEWASWCRAQGDRYPTLNKTQMVSRDSFQLCSCVSVQLLVEALRYLYTRSATSAAFIRTQMPTQPVATSIIERIESVDKSAPLYDQLHHLLQVLFCTDGVYSGTDVAYINSFFDNVQSFISTYGSDARALLKYWNEQMQQSSINADNSIDAIRMMTIHTSKGLEGKTVIVLDAAWDVEKDRNSDILWSESMPAKDSKDLLFIPIHQGKELQYTGKDSPYERAYVEEHEAQRIDNYNMLYVALTRAEDNLYVYALPEIGAHSKGSPTVAAPLLDYTGLRDKLSTVTEQSPYLEYSVGGQPVIHIPGSSTQANVLSFMGAKPVTTQVYSDGSQVHFRQSQESEQYTQESAGKEMSSTQTDFGLLCHDIFAHIRVESDAPKVLELYRQQGLIEDDEQFARIQQLIANAFNSAKMKQWFDGSWQLMREMAILKPASVIRPDRVMIKGDKAVVLDYKFTSEQRPGYMSQVRDYMSALKNMQYKQVEGWLWYAFNNELVQVEM